jgi:hypothetical protein
MKLHRAMPLAQASWRRYRTLRLAIRVRVHYRLIAEAQGHAWSGERFAERTPPRLRFENRWRIAVQDAGRGGGHALARAHAGEPPRGRELPAPALRRHDVAHDEELPDEPVRGSGMSRALDGGSKERGRWLGRRRERA